MINKYKWPYTRLDPHPAVPKLHLNVINRANPTQQTEASFIVDSGAAYTIVGNALIKELDLQSKGFQIPIGTIGTAPKDRDTTKVYIEIPELDFKLPITAIMVKPENSAQENDPRAMQIINLNFLGRDFMNKINVILIGVRSEFWIQCST